MAQLEITVPPDPHGAWGGGFSVPHTAPWVMGQLNLFAPCPIPMNGAKGHWVFYKYLTLCMKIPITHTHLLHRDGIAPITHAPFTILLAFEPHPHSDRFTFQGPLYPYPF